MTGSFSDVGSTDALQVQPGRSIRVQLSVASTESFIGTVQIERRHKGDTWDVVRNGSDALQVFTGTELAPLTDSVVDLTLVNERATPEQYRVTVLVFDAASDDLVYDVAIVRQAGTIAKTDLAGGFSRVSVVDGEDETSTHQITCTDMEAGDEVVAVLVLTTKASIATLAAHAGTLTAGAGLITPGTEVDNTSNQYVIFWNDLT